MRSYISLRRDRPIWGHWINTSRVIWQLEHISYQRVPAISYHLYIKHLSHFYTRSWKCRALNINRLNNCLRIYLKVCQSLPPIHYISISYLHCYSHWNMLNKEIKLLSGLHSIELWHWNWLSFYLRLSRLRIKPLHIISRSCVCKLRLGR